MFDSRRKPRCKTKYITLTQRIRAVGREENALSATWDRVAFCTHSSPLSHTYANVPLLTQVAWKHPGPHRNTKNPVWLDYTHTYTCTHMQTYRQQEVYVLSLCLLKCHGEGWTRHTGQSERTHTQRSFCRLHVCTLTPIALHEFHLL